ncbi:IDI1 family protein [Megaselia abdita]
MLLHSPVSKRECHTIKDNGQLLLHRAFSVFLFNKRGELLLQRRSLSKITYPDLYTNTCCSHPLFDIPEEREERAELGVRKAAQRRLNFELGIPMEQIEPQEFNFVTRILYKDLGDGVWGEHELDYLLFLQKDVDLDPNPNEVSEVRYVQRQNVERTLNNLEAPLTPWFKLILEHKLCFWWDHLYEINRFQDRANIHKLE